MTFSLNEIEMMSKRATRGAGYHWGHAEEAGKAARWLTRRHMPGAEQLAELLIRNDGKNYDDLAPFSIEDVWEANSGWLCPLISGASLCDRADEIASGRVFELGPTAQPLLLTPYASAIAKLTNSTIEISWAGIVMTFTPEGKSIEGEDKALTTRTTDTLTCRRIDTKEIKRNDRAPGRAVDAETWSQLNTFAQRIFAPASEASRLAGAGAGLTDND